VKSRLRTLVNTALLLGIAAISTFWFLQWASVRTPSEPLVPVPSGDRVARTLPIDTGPAARLFGSDQTGRLAEPPQASPALRIRLDGVIAEGGRGKGIALLSVDERAALAYRAGDAIDAHHTLADVRADRVIIRTGSGRIEVTLPERPPPTGIVPVR
jgi:type II secretory pathway component PulC